MKLAKDSISRELGSLQGWKLEGDAITKQFVFKDFKEAMDFVNSVADIAEKADHHPDITINYKRVTLTLSTHSEGGVTQKDIDLAKDIENI
jgi:4a-hydroxytetrahydrobiopterin dehydratase